MREIPGTDTQICEMLIFWQTFTSQHCRKHGIIPTIDDIKYYTGIPINLSTHHKPTIQPLRHYIMFSDFQFTRAHNNIKRSRRKTSQRSIAITVYFPPYFTAMQVAHDWQAAATRPSGCQRCLCSWCTPNTQGRRQQERWSSTLVWSPCLATVCSLCTGGSAFGRTTPVIKQHKRNHNVKVFGENTWEL